MKTDGFVRIRVRQGESEIEVEGPAAVVETIADKWWAALGEGHDSGDTPRPRRKTGAAPHTRKEKTETSNSDESADSTFDATKTANAIKDHEHHGWFVKEILHKRSLWKKVQLVLYIEQDLTSGQIAKVLDELDVSASQPAVSRCLDTNGSSLKRDEARRKGKVPRYRLLAVSRSEFESSMGASG